MKNLFLKLAALSFAACIAAAIAGCSAGAGNNDNELIPDSEIQAPSELPGEQLPPNVSEPETPETPPEVPAVKTISYIKVLGDSVNLRSGATTGSTVRGSAEKSTLYAFMGAESGWYKTVYKGKTAYISAQYCAIVEMEASGDDRVESVISEGCKYLGTTYVYGAVRLHDGKGNLLNNFTTSQFDCSSLMQYMFYEGANTLLQVTTRTQVSQGKTVNGSNLKRGDLMFFTNESRKNLTGVERIGHVAMYLGDNMILHTASDYAKIENISSKRWSYFIQGQRIL